MANASFKSLIFLLQNRFLKTSAAAPLSSSSSLPTSSFTVEFLVKSCGFPLEAALSTSQNLMLYEKKSEKYESFANFLKSHEFTDTHVVKLITKRPSIMHTRVCEKHHLKLQYLKDNGFSSSLLPEIIISNPAILTRGLDSRIQPSFEFLKKYIRSSEQIVAAVKRSPLLLTYDHETVLQPNVDILISEGVPMEGIRKLIVMHPRVIMGRVNKMRNTVKVVKELGLKPDAPMFIHIVRTLACLSDVTWKRKVELFKSLGWSDDDIMTALKTDPLCLCCSEEKIRDAMSFFVDTLKLEREVLINYPKFILYSIDKRMRPRYDLLRFLESKELLTWDPKLIWVLVQPEKKFVKNYVTKYLNQVPNLMKLYSAGMKPM